MPRYQLIVAYEDCYVKVDNCHELTDALSAMAIYLEDPTSQLANIYDRVSMQMIFNWTRPDP